MSGPNAVEWLPVVRDPLWSDLERDRVHVLRVRDPRLRAKSVLQWARRNRTHAHATVFGPYLLVLIDSPDPAGCDHSFIRVGRARTCRWCFTEAGVPLEAPETPPNGR